MKEGMRTQMQQLLEDETTRPQAIEVIRALIDRIEIHPGEQHIPAEMEHLAGHDEHPGP